MHLFGEDKFNIIVAPSHWSSSCFAIQTFMNMVCEGIQCRLFTAQGILYNEWLGGSWRGFTTGVNIPMVLRCIGVRAMSHDSDWPVSRLRSGEAFDCLLLVVLHPSSMLGDVKMGTDL